MSEEPENKTFTVKLFQSHWMRSNTETFTVEASDAEAAKKLVTEEHLANKDLLEDKENKWELETEEVVSVGTARIEEPEQPVAAAAGAVGEVAANVEEDQSRALPATAPELPAATESESTDTAAPADGEEDTSATDSRSDVHTKVD